MSKRLAVALVATICSSSIGSMSNQSVAQDSIKYACGEQFSPRERTVANQIIIKRVVEEQPITPTKSTHHHEAAQVRLADYYDDAEATLNRSAQAVRRTLNRKSNSRSKTFVHPDDRPRTQEMVAASPDDARRKWSFLASVVKLPAMLGGQIDGKASSQEPATDKTGDAATIEREPGMTPEELADYVKQRRAKRLRWNWPRAQKPDR